MFVSKEVISIIFRVINFFAFGFLIYYVFKKYQLITLKEKFAEKHALFDDLEKQQINLIEENEIVSNEIKDQDKLFEMLKNKINTWNNVREENEKTLQEKLEKIKEAYKKRVEKQTEHIHEQKLLKEVLPVVIEGTYKQLEDKFSKKDASETFLKDIVSYMEKNAQ